MRKHIIITLSLLMGLYLTGCKGVLDENVYSELYPDGLFDTEEGVEAVLYDGYNNLTFHGSNGNMIRNMEEWCTDIEWETSGNENKTAVYMINFNWDATLSQFYSYFWSWPYSAISDANEVLDNIGDSSLPDDEITEYTAEARFIRAMAYYYLYGWFGPVPLRTSETQEADQARATDDEMQEFIEDEFTDIIPDLPNPGDEAEYGRAHKGAAWAFLCKFYLNTKQWQNCINAADSLIALNYYELYDSYTDLFKVENERNNEFIWVHQCSTSAGGNEYINGAFPPSFYIEPISGFTWNSSSMSNWAAQYRLYDSFYNSFEDGDERKNLIVSSYINLDGDTVSLLDDDDTRSFKYWPDDDAVANRHGNDIPEIRYADILLSKAEAINELDGPTEEAVDLVNQIRNRAGLGDISASDYDQDSFRDHLLDERGWEFYSERKRRQDLIRMGKFISSAQDRGYDAEDYQVLFPIPQDEMDANPNLVQNDGY